MDMYITKEEKEQNIPIPYRDGGYRSLLQSDALYDVITQLLLYFNFNLLIVKLYILNYIIILLFLH
jgi:hypothetical protein